MSAPVLKIELSADAREMLQTLPEAADRAMPALAKELNRQNELTIGLAQRTRLTGPRPEILGVRTGRLRRSLSRSPVVISGDLLIGGIGSNVAYAAVHEYGFDGDVQVSAFTRRNPKRDVRNRKGKTIATGISYVSAFTRHMRMPARSFVRASIQERLKQYGDGLGRAVVRTLEGES